MHVCKIYTGCIQCLQNHIANLLKTVRRIMCFDEKNKDTIYKVNKVNKNYRV